MIRQIQVYELNVPPRAMLRVVSSRTKQEGDSLIYSPASFKMRRFVQCFMIIARGRTRSSASTYVLIIRVFSSADVLLTFISQATCSSGSHILTIGTFAWETHTTRSIPPVTWSAQERLTQRPHNILFARKSANMHTCSNSLNGVVMQMSTNRNNFSHHRNTEHLKTALTIRITGA